MRIIIASNLDIVLRKEFFVARLVGVSAVESMQRSAVQCSAVQCSAVQCRAVPAHKNGKNCSH
jgi:hypothetical protein